MTSSIYIIGGPTASGKSDYAVNLAKQINGEIINADSMQLYSHLCILTARPINLQNISHHLYGILQGNQISSVGWWYEKACDAIQDGKTPVVVGGTGLYLHALTDGLSPIPEIPQVIRQEVRRLAQTLDDKDFFTLVSREDPKIQSVLHPHDTQRLTRALEVIWTTQQSIQDWQKQSQKKLKLKCEYIILLPPRNILYQWINNRFVKMIENGAIEEVKALLAQHIDPSSPILKAVGVPELKEYLQASLSLDQAIALGQQSTRRYAKRQITWFTHQVAKSNHTITKVISRF